jgi:hypothetical protein
MQEKQLTQSAEQFEKTNELDWAKLQESQRQADASLSFDERKLKMQYAQDNVTAILANGQIPSTELLVAAGLSLEDAKKMIAQEQGTGGGPAPKPKEGNSKVVYTDGNGKYYTYVSHKDGVMEKKEVSASEVGNNDIVQNIYTAGAERRRTNKK